MSESRPAGPGARAIRPRATRRTFLRGVGVTMALPWLESVPVWGAATMVGDVPAPCPKRFAALFMGCGINPTNWWAKGAGASMELGRCLEPLAPLKAKINVVHGLFNKHATGVGIHPGDDRQHPLRRGAPEGGRAQGGHQHRPGAGEAPGRGDRPAEHGPGLRAADHRLPRDELLDGLQLAHLLAERDLAGADGGLSLARLRQPLRQPREPAQPEHPRPRPRAGRRPGPRGQPRRPGQARRVPDQRPRGRDAGPPRCGPRSSRPTTAPATAAAPPRRCPGPTTASPRTSASTCG